MCVSIGLSGLHCKHCSRDLNSQKLCQRSLKLMFLQACTYVHTYMHNTHTHTYIYIHIYIRIIYSGHCYCPHIFINRYSKHPIVIIYKDSKPSSITKLFIFPKFSVLYYTFLPIWPSAGNTTMYEIRGRKLSTYRIIKLNGI
jgi:hypothetical protein